ncbi:response regulator [Sphingobium sp. DEHP117]|uniref:response regulator n=1 Tax=Sphingobium sp. DEHP117 TaxID=2993436 RepID=UPI0027D67656|nr:response regulator [Sphingobium sp. DEHP117]MDQ4419046.1 response regulator [Sphingobium sp. DEHP117]
MMRPLKKILYLEDDDVIAELVMISLIEISGYDVKHFNNGTAAIKSATRFKPQLCLFDVMLPKMDGPSTLNNIRLIPGFSNVPVIFMTAKAQVHQQKTYMDMGALGVILKPFDPISLGEQIHALWQDRGRGEARV